MSTAHTVHKHKYKQNTQIHKIKIVVFKLGGEFKRMNEVAEKIKTNCP